MDCPAPTFPFATEFNLRGLIRFWEAAAADPASPWHPFALAVTEQLAAAPALRADVVEAAALAEHAPLVRLLLSAVVPPSRWEEEVAAVLTPFGIRLFYATPAAERLGLFRPEELPLRMQLSHEEFELGRTMLAYYALLDRCYGLDVGCEFPLTLTLADVETGLERHFRIAVDARFVEVHARGGVPPLSEEDFARLSAEPTRRELWERLLPPDRFTFAGFSVLTAHDVTDQHVLSALKDDLLQRGAMTSPESIAMLESRFRSLLGCPDLEFGLICLEGGTFDEASLCCDVPRVRPVGRSLLLSNGPAPRCPDMCDSLYARALESETPVGLSDLCADGERTAFEAHLVALGFRSIVVARLRVGGQTVGLLELASKRAGALNAFNTMRVHDVTGLFATALRRSLDEREDHLQAVIKAQCTAIHPVVEWRFRDAAAKYLDLPEEARPRQLEPIVFSEVFPLYGLSDIRNSSTERARCVAEDLTEQLGLALGAVVEATAYRSLPGLDELGYRLQRHAADVGNGLSSEHEGTLLEFLRHEVEALFDHLATFGPRVRERIEAYRAALDPEVGMVYRARKRYEASVTMINEAISNHLEAQDAHAQALTPHYFEKYKTDGVDHTLYVGPALLENPQRFDPLSLRNLRLWQLMTMCSTAWALGRLTPELPMPLETSHLVLVHDAPLGIRFRYDEKQFDVDGAYNTRYAIVKKRIDKAYLAGTEERLTRPGALAIVYAEPRAAQEYRTYLDYLQDAGYVGGPIEHVDLEPMPGAQGLRAFRVPIGTEPRGMDLAVAAARTSRAAGAA